MKKPIYYINKDILAQYRNYLIMKECSKATIEKYMRDIEMFYNFLGADKQISKERIIAYKYYLLEHYQISSVNSMLAALNNLLFWLKLDDCRVKSIRKQRQIFCDSDQELDKEEYRRLIDTARKTGNKRLEMIIQTIGGTGIRISELRSITVEAVRNGKAEVYTKGKNRIVFLPTKVREYLRIYCREKKIDSGMIFITRTGKPMDRSNIWREMKKLSQLAEVEAKKVFPHNLRHLFARTFYEKRKDIVYLADILGHSSVETTRIYTISSGQEHRQMLDDLNLVV